MRQAKLTDIQFAVLKALKTVDLSSREIFAAIGMSGDTRSFNRNIAPLLSGGLVEMTVSEKQNSKLQKYKLTDKGEAAIV